MGAFAYKHYKDDVPPGIKRERLEYLMRIQEIISAGLIPGEFYPIHIHAAAFDLYGKITSP
jgi:hypothetical protein